MNGYHCYVLNKEGKIHSRHDIETESDADAVLKAETVAGDLSDEFPERRLARPPSLGQRRAS
jgi:hypothetical protein